MTTKTYEAGSRIGDRIIRVQELKAQINALEAELDSEKAYLLAHAENHEFQCLQCGPTKLSRRERIVWTYSDSIKQAEKRLKGRKQQEQDSGVALASHSNHLVITTSIKDLVAIQFNSEAVK
jgi:hypothetical protein